MRPALVALFAAAAWTASACVGPASAAGDPDWRGAPVHLRHLGDGGVEVEFVAPTAGHAFALRDVVRAGARAEVVCEHAPPTADFVAQVVSPLRLVVPAARLGDAAVVAVVIADGGRTALALVSARPR